MCVCVPPNQTKIPCTHFHAGKKYNQKIRKDLAVSRPSTTTTSTTCTVVTAKTVWPESHCRVTERWALQVSAPAAGPLVRCPPPGVRPVSTAPTPQPPPTRPRPDPPRKPFPAPKLTKRTMNHAVNRKILAHFLTHSVCK